MRDRPLTFARALELCYYNVATAVLLIAGDYYCRLPIGEVEFKRCLVATRDQVRAAVQTTGGDFFRAGQQLLAAYQERVVASGKPDETMLEAADA